MNKKRDYLFDNCKVLLILLVVIGHFIEPCYKNSDFLYVLKWFIVSFHMPAFIFISGYFSKRELSLGVLIHKLAIPYIVYEIMYYLLYTYVLHKKTGLYLLMPKFSLWYLLALFVWRAVTPYVKKIPHYMLVTLAAGLLIGCSGMKDNFLSLPRILVFYPYFLAGMNFERGILTRLRTKTNQIFAGMFTCTLITVFALVPIFKECSPKAFYGRYNYEFLNQTVIEGILCRLACYGVGFVMTFALMILMTERKTICSYIGTRTMAIYLFHGLIYSCLKETALLKGVSTLWESIILVGACVVLTALLSIPQLTTFTNMVANIRLPKFPISAYTYRKYIAPCEEVLYI